jgi:hypothetical protein
MASGSAAVTALAHRWIGFERHRVGAKGEIGPTRMDAARSDFCCSFGRHTSARIASAMKHSGSRKQVLAKVNFQQSAACRGF